MESEEQTALTKPKRVMRPRSAKHCAALSRAGQGNVNRSRSPWATFWKRQALRKDQRHALKIAQETLDQITSDLPDLTGAEAQLLRQLSIANVAAVLCMEQLAKAGAFDAEGAAMPALQALPKYLAEARQSLSLLGLTRRTRQADGLAAYLAKRATPAARAVINVRAQQIEEAGDVVNALTTADSEASE